MSVTELTVSLFKEYLKLNEFNKTVELFKSECDSKKITSSITKRL